MIAVGEHELICDFAETYRIYDYKSLPARLAAIFACGLGDDARIMRKLRGDRISRQESIQALMFDLVSEYIWAIGGGEGEKPASLFRMLAGEEEERGGRVRGFSTPKEFEEVRQRLIGG